MSERRAFIREIALKALETRGVASLDDALGFVVGVVDLAWPPEPSEEIEVRGFPADGGDDRVAQGEPAPPPATSGDASPADEHAGPPRETAADEADGGGRTRIRWDNDKDAALRRLRLVEGLSWKQIAARIAGDEEADAACSQRAFVLKKRGLWSIDVTDRALAAAAGQASSLGGVI